MAVQTPGSAATLTPIPINRAPIAAETSQEQAQQQGGLRGRVEQQVDAITGSANKVISGVVDSFGMLRQLLPGTPDIGGESTTLVASGEGGVVVAQSGAWSYIPTNFGLLRREAGLSIASIAASLPGAGGARSGSRMGQAGEESGQPLVAVSRPSSVRNEGDEGHGADEGDDQDSVEHREFSEHDSRSIRSFESMMSGKARVGSRKSLSDRLASVSGLTRAQHVHRESEASLKVIGSRCSIVGRITEERL